MQSVIVLADYADFKCAKSFADSLNWHCDIINVEQFCNGELNITLPQIDSKYDKCLIFIRNHQNTNSMIMRACLISMKLRGVCNNICINVLFSYFPYSRHDRGIPEFSTFYDILKLLKTCGISKVYGIDLHIDLDFVDKINREFGCLFLCNIPIFGILNSILQRHEISSIIFPDKGAEKRLNEEILDGINTITCKKNRMANGDITFEYNNNEVIVDKNSCIVVDDVVHSCNTLLNIFKNVLHGVYLPVFCFVTHLDITSTGLRCLNSLRVKKLYTTSSVVSGAGAVLVPCEVLAIEDILSDYFLVNSL